MSVKRRAGAGAPLEFVEGGPGRTLEGRVVVPFAVRTIPPLLDTVNSSCYAPRMSTALNTMLVRSLDVCGGRLRIKDTRITVLQISTLFRQGLSAEEMTREYPHAPEGGIYAALAYYLANRDEIAAELDSEEAAANTAKADDSQLTP